MNFVEAIQRIEKSLDIDLNTRELEASEKSERILFLSGLNSNGMEERYSIYNCSENNCKFDMAEYQEMMSDEDGLSTQIIVFKNWDCERKIFWEAYDSVNTGKDKKKINEYFTKKISVYTESDDTVALQVDEGGINYLEYKAEENSELKGYIYNVTIFELKKLFNVTGTTLFKMNVRNGLKKNHTGKELRRKFRNYMCVGLYTMLMKDTGMEEHRGELKDILEIKDEDVIKNSIPQKFWFYHNGITIYSMDTKIDRTGDYIKLAPQQVSVINGAQTLTNFFAEWDELRHTLPSELKGIAAISEESIESMLDSICKLIAVKTICIEGELKNVRLITNGLNTQIPIFKEDIIADQDIVREINQHILKGGMKILKSGEDTYNGVGLDVVEFVKKYLLIENQPGRSKNLKKADIEELLKKAQKRFETSEEKRLIRQFEVLKELDTWWYESKTERKNICETELDRIIDNYGKNYFASYYLNETEEAVAPEYTFALYNSFRELLKSLDSDIELRSFKKDELFNLYLEHKKNSDRKKEEHTVGFTTEELDMLMDYLDSQEISQYAYAKCISEYVESSGKQIKYFRVIKRFKNNKDKFFPKEAFPFPSSTFTELYQDMEDLLEKEYLDYEQSSFNKEIHKTYPVFVLELEKDENGKNKIKDIDYVPSFSFKEFEKQAKEVYEQTVVAFKAGDEKLFPKMSDGMMFHVRPKAVNSEDTFEFTDGTQITKRTFWANRDTINILIENSIQRSKKI